MAWVPVADSPFPFTFEPSLPYLPGPRMVGSTVTTEGEANGRGWAFSFDDGIERQIRISALSFSSSGLGLASFTAQPSYDGVQNEGGASSWAPSPMEFLASGVDYNPGFGTEEQDVESFEFLLEVLSGDPPPPAPQGECEEHGRATRAYVSGYDRARVHRSRLVRGDRRCLIADFNGAIPLSRRIVSATWRTNQAYASILSDARIVGREVAVDMTAGSGLSRIKCEATLDNGEVYSQLFIVRSIGGPWFQGETSTTAGPNELTATAP